MRASVLVTMSRCADKDRGRLHLHRQRFVVADAGTVEAGFDDLATFGIQIVFKESTNLIVEEVRQNLGTCVGAFKTPTSGCVSTCKNQWPIVCPSI